MVEANTAIDFKGLRLAVILPCYNEGIAIKKTISDFRAALPVAQIYVCDNNSTDDTVEVALAAGAVVSRERFQGKGNVVRRMFADVEADIYILADGDATYDASAAPAMVARMIAENLDMVVGARRTELVDAYRRGHRFGNAFLTGLLARLFGKTFGDILSGYRVFSRRFVKSFPALSTGFEVETEISVHALELRLPVAEVETAYGARLEGSTSKLSTYKDGLRILQIIFRLLRSERPFFFFGSMAAAFVIASVILIAPVIVEYFETGLVRRFPTAILSLGMVTIAVIQIFSGLILENVVRGRQELRRLAYLSQPAVGHMWRK